jgi:hypothetical protein
MTLASAARSLLEAPATTPGSPFSIASKPAQRIRERVDECLGTVVNRLESTRHESCDGAGDENPAFVPSAHLFADSLDQIERARHIGIDDVLHFGELLVQESFAETMPRIRKQRVNGPIPRFRQ